MKIREIVTEVKLGPGGKVDTQQYGSSRVDQRGPGVALPRNERGWPIEPGLEPAPFGPEDLLGVTALAGTAGRKIAQKGSSLIKGTTTARDIAYDIAHKPGVYKPWTWSKVGYDPSFADTQAAKIWKKIYGEPYDPKHGNLMYQQEYKDLVDKFAQRGWHKKPSAIPDLDRKPSGWEQFHTPNPHEPGTPAHSAWNELAQDYAKTIPRKPPETASEKLGLEPFAIRTVAQVGSDPSLRTNMPQDQQQNQAASSPRPKY